MDDVQEIKKLLSPCEDSMMFWQFSSDMAKKINSIVTEATMSYISEGNYNTYKYALKPAPEYLESLSSFLSKCYGESVLSSTLTATYGSSFGFMFIMSHFLEKGDYVFVEDLTFPLCIGSSKEFSLNVESVCCDLDGIDVIELEMKLKECRAKCSREVSEKKPYWAIIFLMTVVHNPKGTIYSEDRSKKIVELARKYNVLVVVDDIYNYYQYDGDTNTKRLVAYDDPSDADYGNGHVISNGSLSKILFPSLRLGWLEASPWIIKQLETTPDYFSGGSYNYFNQGLAAAILNHPRFPEYFEEAKNHYSRFIKLSCEYLEKHLPKEVTLNKPKGGFVLWLELPEGYSSHVLVKRLEKYGMSVWPGDDFSPSKAYTNCFRICVTNYAEKDLLLALEVLCKEITSMLQD